MQVDQLLLPKEVRGDIIRGPAKNQIRHCSLNPGSGLLGARASYLGQKAYTAATEAAFQNQPNPYGTVCLPAIPATPHSSSMMVLLGDASVRSVVPSIGPDTWNKACLPNDGNVLPSDWN